MIGLGACKFLVVDSNPCMREIVDAVLRGFGARAITLAHDGEQALHHLQRTSFDVMTTDFVLTHLDGAELTRQLRRWQDNPNRFMPVIMLTAFSSRPRIEAARDSGVSEICCKPLVPRELFRKLVAVTDYSRSFISCDTFMGPDRRRRQDPAFPGPERRYGAAAGAFPDLSAMAD